MVAITMPTSQASSTLSLQALRMGRSMSRPVALTVVAVTIAAMAEVRSKSRLV